MPRKKVERSAPARMIPVKRAADRLGYSVWTLRRWAYEGKIASHKFPNGRLSIAESEIDRLFTETYRPRIEP
jgi:predicted site-specific integrase-resolvase